VYKVSLKTMKMKASHWNSVIVNTIIIILILVAFIIFEVVLKPFNRGFFCNDQSIQKPYVEKQTVPTMVLVVVTVVLIILVVTLCNCYKRYLCNEKSKGMQQLCCLMTNKWMHRLLSHIVLAFVGFAICIIITGLGKRMVGRLRPHFIAVCQPDYSKFNCTDGYITFDVCTQTDEKKLKEARVSFPSGHASSSAFVATFSIFYIECFVKTKPNMQLAKTFFQLVFLCLGIACSLTRISDYFHHWSDVFVGLLIGVISAVYTIFVLMRLRLNERRNYKNESHQVDVEEVAGGAV